MLFNKERRIKYLGFDDVWFSIVGIIILSFLVDYLIINSFGRFPLQEALISYSISILFATLNWVIIRPVIMLLRKKYPGLKDSLKRIAIMFLGIISTVLLVDQIVNFIFSSVLPESFNYHSNYTILVQICVINLMTIAVYEAIYFHIQLKDSIRREEQTKQAIIQAQLDTLKNQAQPHFLFNTLNTLRDIIDQNAKEDAKKFVDKLSDIYRFILESGKINTTSLGKELKFAKAYMHIQSERFGENLSVNWNIPEDKMGSIIIPMSLQLLLENAMKHNVISRAKPLEINVTVKGNNLVISNKIQAKSTQLHSTKMGLKNIETRYKLITGQSIEIVNDQDQFIVSLPLLQSTDQITNHEGINH